MKVCPECGNNTFEVIEHSHVTIAINGEGEFIQTLNDWILDRREFPAICPECEGEYKSLSELITKEEFESRQKVGE